MFSTVRFILALALAHLVKGGPCEDKGGTCLDWRQHDCPAGIERGICPGDTNIRCCLACNSQCQANEAYWTRYRDSACSSSGGSCRHITNYCPGGYESGKCGGPSERRCCKTTKGGCPKIISRNEWGGRSSGCRQGTLSGDRPYLFVHHSVTSTCSSQSSCSSIMRGIQRYHMDSRGYCDIGYSFVIGGDGNVYEGRGFDTVGAHTGGYNSQGFGVCFLGNFMNQSPTQQAVEAFNQLAQCLVDKEKLSSSYQLKAHLQTKATSCPGDTLYNDLQSWPRWTAGSIGK